MSLLPVISLHPIAVALFQLLLPNVADSKHVAQAPEADDLKYFS